MKTTATRFKWAGTVAALLVTASCSTEEPRRGKLGKPQTDIMGVTGEQISGDAIASTRLETQSLQAEVNKLKVDLAASQTLLTRERDREGKLTRELTDINAMGCWGDQPVRSFELRVTGAHLASGNQWESQDPVESDPNAAQVVFSFGPEMVYTNPNEEESALFTANGTFVTERYAGQRIGDIESIRIVKGGRSVESVQHCWREWLVFNRCRWQHEETNVYRLDALEILVNEQVVFQKSGINHTFDSEHLAWEDFNLSLNPAYQTLMARNDCPASGIDR